MTNKSTFLTILLLAIGMLLPMSACREHSAADKRGGDVSRETVVETTTSAAETSASTADSSTVDSSTVDLSTAKTETAAENSLPLDSSVNAASGKNSFSVVPEPQKIPKKIDWSMPKQAADSNPQPAVSDSETTSETTSNEPQAEVASTEAAADESNVTVNENNAAPNENDVTENEKQHQSENESAQSETSPQVDVPEFTLPSETNLNENAPTSNENETTSSEITPPETIPQEETPSNHYELTVPEFVPLESSETPDKDNSFESAEREVQSAELETGNVNESAERKAQNAELEAGNVNVLPQEEENSWQNNSTQESSTQDNSTQENQPSNTETLDEDVWESKTNQEWQSLENVEIKQQEPPRPLKKVMPESIIPDTPNTMSDSIPPTLRNELETQTQDLFSPNPQPETPAQPPQETLATPAPQFNDKPIELTIIPKVPSQMPILPNLQPTEQTDDNPFGADFDAIESPQPSNNAPAPASQEKDDFASGGENFDTFGETPSSPEKTESATPTDSNEITSAPTNAVAPETAKRPAAEPLSPTTSAENESETAAEPLSEVEKYLLNEAKRSPVRLMESIELLYKLNKPQLAKQLLRQFLAIELTQEDCLQINKQVNAAILLRISVDEAYQPEGGNAVRKIVEGAKNYFESRIAIEKALQTFLAAERQSEKDDAAQIILNGRETAIEFLLDRLAKSTDEKEITVISSLLLTMNEDARHALQESLITTSPLGIRAARILAQMGRSSDSRFLLPLMFDGNLSAGERAEAASLVQSLSRKIPSREEAAATLFSAATNYYREKVPFRTDENYNVPLWKLQAGDDSPKFVTISEQDASRYFAEKFAHYAVTLDSSKSAYKQLWLITSFDLKGAEIGNDNAVIKFDPAFINAVKNDYTVAEIEKVLSVAMQQNHPIAARVATEILGQIGTADELIYKRGSQSPLVKAAGFSDRRVRFAAILSIMTLNPQKQYAGSSVISQSLVFFSRAAGVKRAIVASPWIGDANVIAGYLAPLGYKSEIASQGRQAMQLAIDSADTELMMLDTRVPNSNVEFLVQDMRADNRTHDVPIAVLASEGQLTRAQRAAYGSKMAYAYPRPTDEASAKALVENLLKETGVEHVPPERRLEEAKLSIAWIADLYARSTIYRFENIEQIAYNTLWEPQLMSESLQLLKQIPTPTAQQLMSQVISTPMLPIEQRQQAVEAFRYNAQRFGVLIRGRLILDLYDAYNASGNEPIASQQARSTLLDIIEEYANYMQRVNYKK